MKIVLFSDIHYGNESSYEGTGPFTKNQHVEFAEKIHSEKPDVIVATGDLAETNWGIHLLKEFFSTYRNPYGESLFIPGNHDVWCTNNGISPEEKYAWHHQVGLTHGWQMLKNYPWSKDGLYIAGSMGWFDFSSIPPATGKTPEYYMKKRNFADYNYMGLKFSPRGKQDPMQKFASDRMLDFDTSLGQVPSDRKKLIIVSHIVGFKQLMVQWDEMTAYFGNFNLGKKVLKHKPDLYYCGHTHSFAEAKIEGVRCINNGSGYGLGSKRYDVIEL